MNLGTRLVAVIAMVALAGCGKANHEPDRSSVTMKLPPAKAAEAKPGFSSMSNASDPS